MTTLILLILSSVVLSAVGQVILKVGVEKVDLAGLTESVSVVSAALTALLNPWVALGLVTYGSAAVVWLFVLSRADVSFAYPFLGLAFVMTTALGVVFLGEHVSALRMIGTALVIGGLVLVAMS